MAPNQKIEWFSEWFNSPYYHILYKNRDEREAREFIDIISGYFQFEEGQRALDIACGKGRHSRYLAEKGLNVTGIDLSTENIKYANQYASDNLRFEVHDMRRPYKEDYFDYVFNLFTSFGYFDSADENQKAICTAARSLRKGGRLVIDFLNPYKVVHDLIPEETKIIEGIEFKIKRFIKDSFIFKEISINDNGKESSFYERVKLISRTEFEEYFKVANIEITGIYGDHFLTPFIKEKSDRMLFLLSK